MKPRFGGPLRPVIGVLIFPGSNCDRDTLWALEKVFGLRTRVFWHQDHELSGVDGVVVPGGFSFGDYLRSGALAARSPITEHLVSFCRRGGAAIGICNGFQILTESGLLPGALLPNLTQRFVCRHVFVKDPKDGAGGPLGLPIAHGEGRYYCDAADRRALWDGGQVAYQYCDRTGQIVPEANPNGSQDNIAGIRNPTGRILGLMPHPERALDPDLSGGRGTTAGLRIWEDFFATFL